MSRFLQQSNECFLGSEDCAHFDIYYLCYDAGLVLCPEKIVASVVAADCNYQTVFLENGDYNLARGYDLGSYYVAADGGDGD